MKNITEFNYNCKKVILRLDLNVTIENNIIKNDEKIKASLDTINYLIDNNASVIILSHLGKIKSEEDKKKNTLYKVYEQLCKYLKTNVYFSSSTHGEILESKIKNLKPKDVLLVENTRYEDIPNKLESSCDENLAKYWASLGDIFINDAFGLTHRKHASNYGISKYLSSGVGFLIQKEIEGLKPLFNPTHPFVIIMGGIKIEDKLDVIKNLINKCDYLITGGGIANSFLACKYNVGKSIINKEKTSELEGLLSNYENKILLPTDVVVNKDGEVLVKRIDEVKDNDVIYDIGPETIKNYSNYIKQAKLIFINGTMGKYEEEKYS